MSAMQQTLPLVEPLDVHRDGRRVMRLRAILVQRETTGDAVTVRVRFDGAPVPSGDEYVTFARTPIPELALPGSWEVRDTITGRPLRSPYVCPPVTAWLDVVMAAVGIPTPEPAEASA